MKKLEKWLSRPLMQRLVYLLLLLLVLYTNSSNGVLHKVTSLKTTSLATLAAVLVPVLLLIAQLIWNRKWLWWLLCGLMVCFSLWLATLSMSQLIDGAGGAARRVVWAFGVFGFTALLILLMAFINWMLLHMKPKR